MRRILRLNTFGAFDLSSSTKSGTDFNAGGVIGMDINGRILVLHSFMKRIAEPLECFEEMIDQIIKFKCLEYVMERNRFEFLMDTIEKLLDAGYFNERHNPFEFREAMGKISGVYRNSQSDNKIERIETTLQPLTKSHTIYLHSDMKKERQQFKNYMINDDFLDWLQQAVSIAYPPTDDIYTDDGVHSVKSQNRNDAMAPIEKNLSINELIAEAPYDPWTGLFMENRN